MANPIFVMGYH